LKDGERVVDVEPLAADDEEETDAAGDAGLGEAGDAGDDSLVPGLDTSDDGGSDEGGRGDSGESGDE